jgi:hypothetical protein
MNDKNIKIIFVRHKKVISNLIARYSYFKDILNFSTLKSIYYTLFKKYNFEKLDNGKELIFSHSYLVIDTYKFDIHYLYGVIIQKEDTNEYQNIKYYDNFIFFDNKKMYGVIFNFYINEEEYYKYLEIALDLFSKQYENNQIIKYNWEDLLYFIFPKMHGHSKNYICSTFVYNFLIKIEKIINIGKRIISPNLLFHTLKFSL